MASEVAEAAKINETARAFKAWNITTEVFNGIQVLEFKKPGTDITFF